MKKSLIAQAESMGIPLQIKVDDELRYSYCDAHMASLASIEGKHAVYKGECDNRHTYEVRRLVSELQAEYQLKMTIMNGQVSYGIGEGGFKAGDLQEL